MRYGLDAQIADFARHRNLSMRDSIRDLLALVDDVVDELGSRREMDYIHRLLDDERGTGADRQIAVFNETNDINKVNQFLIEQTMQDVKLDDAMLHDKFIHFMPSETIKA
jgi:glutamate---cysteine ligase / carboxylate-amine ligase